MSEFLELVLAQLFVNAIPFAFWIAVIIFARIMQKRGGGKAERFLITGSSINLVACILHMLLVIFLPGLLGQNDTFDRMVLINTVANIFLDILSMAGIICIIYAFWVKFNNRKAQTVA